jgi:hypothetical protein
MQNPFRSWRWHVERCKLFGRPVAHHTRRITNVNVLVPCFQVCPQVLWSRRRRHVVCTGRRRRRCSAHERLHSLWKLAVFFQSQFSCCADAHKRRTPGVERNDVCVVKPVCVSRKYIAKCHCFRTICTRSDVRKTESRRHRSILHKIQCRRRVRRRKISCPSRKTTPIRVRVRPQRF